MLGEDWEEGGDGGGGMRGRRRWWERVERKEEMVGEG